MEFKFPAVAALDAVAVQAGAGVAGAVAEAAHVKAPDAAVSNPCLAWRAWHGSARIESASA